jgi:hypothetical protein
MEGKTERKAVVGFAEYMKLNSFGNFLLNSKSNFAVNMDNFLASIHVSSFYNQAEDKIIEYVPSVFYTPVKERKEYILLTSDGGSNIKSCAFDDKPSDRPSIMSIQILVMESYKQDVLQKAILKAIKKNEKKRNKTS